VPVCVAAFVTGAALAGARGDRGAADAGAVIWFAGLVVTADRDQSSARPGDAVGPGTTSGGRPAAFDESALQASASAYLERVAPDDAADEDPAPRSAAALPAVRRSPLDTGRISERVQIGVLDTQREASSVADTTEVAVESLRFGHFKALHMIGEGAMSRVYVALDEELDRKVAVKLFHPTSDPADRFRGQREAQALARISHPNVVQIYESGSLGAHTFIVMEFVEGVTLTTWQAEHPRSLQELLRMYIAVGRGLVAAHSAGVVHRDFKPESGLASQVPENTSVSLLRRGYVPTVYQAGRPVKCRPATRPTRRNRARPASAMRRDAHASGESGPVSRRQSIMTTPSITLDSFNLSVAERLLCTRALEVSGNIVEAAKLLGITRHALKRRMIKHVIASPRRSETP
jgi:hypothetical protein